MSSLAEQMADEWWFKIRERAIQLRNKKVSPVNKATQDFIFHDILQADASISSATAMDAAKLACEILKERVSKFYAEQGDR